MVEYISCQQVHALTMRDLDAVARFTFPVPVVCCQYDEVKLCARVICRLASVDAAGVDAFGFASPIPDGDGFAVQMEVFIGVFSADSRLEFADKKETLVTDVTLRDAVLLRLPFLVGARDAQPLPPGYVRLRLLGVDAHEMKVPHIAEAVAARDALTNWLQRGSHAKLVLDLFSVDHYGRVLAVVRTAAAAFAPIDVANMAQGTFELGERFSMLVPRLLDDGHITTVPHIIQVRAWQQAQLRATHPFSGPTPLETRVHERNESHDAITCAVGLVVSRYTLHHGSTILDFHRAIRESSSIAQKFYVYDRYFSLLPAPFSFIRPRFSDNGLGIGLYITLYPGMAEVTFPEGFKIDVPDQCEFNPGAPTSEMWRVESRRGGQASRYSDPYACFSPGMLLNERTTTEHEVAVAHETFVHAQFVHMRQGDLYRRQKDVGSKFLSLLVPESYAGSTLSTGVLAINSGTYPDNTQLLTYYGRDFDRGGYPNTPMETPQALSAPAIAHQDVMDTEFPSQAAASQSQTI